MIAGRVEELLAAGMSPERRAQLQELVGLLDRGDFDAFAHRMRDEGQNEWRRLAVAHPPGTGTGKAVTTGAVPHQRTTVQRDRLPGRQLSLAEAVVALGQLPPPPKPTLHDADTRVRTRWRVAAAAGVAAAVIAVLLGYHPPRLVLSAGRPIDVTPDIRVTGAPVFPPRGHYLMLWVKATQPNLAGYLTALARGRTTRPLDQGAETSERLIGREQYLDSQRTAIRLAIAAAGLDPRRVTVHVRDRGLLGPSAGLAYALAIEDLLTPGDLTGGRSIGVTGALLRDGRIAPIGWLLLKAHGALQDHATLLIVPGEEATTVVRRLTMTCGVATFADTLRALAARCAPA